MSSSKLSRNHYYGCIGREENQKDLLHVWKKRIKRIFICFGGKESGKSCFIRTCLDDLLQKEASEYCVIDIDFKKETIGPKDSDKFSGNLVKKLQKEKIEIRISDVMKEESLESFFEEIQERKIIFLFDNLDYARNAKADDNSSSADKDLFSELQDNFIPGIVERTDLCMVFITSTVQLRYGQIAPKVHKIEMNALSTESAGELLLKTFELTADMDKTSTRDYLGPYLKHIARLSEGIPMAVIVTGIQLTENNRFIKPKDMLTVLIFSRMYTLSPEFFPKDDNMFQTYGEYIEKQSSTMKERLQEMGKTDCSSFTVETLMQHLPAEEGTALFKTRTVTPLMLRSFVKHVENADKSETLEMPGFLREFVNIEEFSNSSNGLDGEVRSACRNVVRDCLLRLGIKFDIEDVKKIIENPSRFDDFVENTIIGTTPEDTDNGKQKDLGKNDLGRPFTGYSPESLLRYSNESNLSDLPEQRMEDLKLPEISDKNKGAVIERKVSKTTKGDVAYTSTASPTDKNSEEIERDFLQRGVTDNGHETKENGIKNDKFDNTSNLSSSYGDKQYPHNKMDPSVMEGHTGPKEAENRVGFSPESSSDLNYFRDKCTQQTDENGANGLDLHEIDVNTGKKRSYLEHKVNRTSKDDEGYGSPQNSDSDEQASPDPGVVPNPD